MHLFLDNYDSHNGRYILRLRCFIIIGQIEEITDSDETHKRGATFIG